MTFALTWRNGLMHSPFVDVSHWVSPRPRSHVKGEPGAPDRRSWRGTRETAAHLGQLPATVLSLNDLAEEHSVRPTTIRSERLRGNDRRPRPKQTVESFSRFVGMACSGLSEWTAKLLKCDAVEIISSRFRGRKEFAARAVQVGRDVYAACSSPLRGEGTGWGSPGRAPHPTAIDG